MANVTEMPPTEAASSEAVGSKTSPTATSGLQPPKNKTGRPRKGEEIDPETRARQFFDRAAQIPSEDWGNRAWMYLYIDEPVCDEKQWGKMRYAKKLHQPIFDLEKIKDWYGSCKGWISLNLRKPDAQNTDQIGRHEFEIFDIHCPPKIPKACWTDDPVNKKWAALLPPEPKAQAEGATSLLDSIKVYKEIRDEVRDEREEPETPFDQTRSTLETMKLAKELFAPATSATATTVTPPPDPFDTAAKIMAMRANDPMMAVMMELLKNANTANEAARQREYELLVKQQTAMPSKGIVDQLLEIASNAEKLKPLKEIFGFGSSNGEVTGRAARTTGMDILNNLVSGPAGTMLAQGLGTLLVNLPRMFTPAEGAPGQGQPPPQPIVLPPPGAPPTQMPETPEQKLQRIGMTVTEPMLYEFFLRGATGDVWADRMNDLWPNDYAFVRSIGPDVLVNHYRQTRAWMLIAPKETEFKQFMTEFCAFDPTAEGTDQPEDESGIVDLEAEETEV
jgi:hypothetical protein